MLVATRKQGAALFRLRGRSGVRPAQPRQEFCLFVKGEAPWTCVAAWRERALSVRGLPRCVARERGVRGSRGALSATFRDAYCAKVRADMRASSILLASSLPGGAVRTTILRSMLPAVRTSQSTLISPTVGCMIAFVVFGVFAGRAVSP